MRRPWEPGFAASDLDVTVLAPSSEPSSEVQESDLAQLVERWLADAPGGSERLIPLLHHVQRHLGCVPQNVQELVADRLGVAPIQVEGVVSFYNAFTTTPRGRLPIRICMGTACFVAGGQSLLPALEDALGVGVGGVSGDRLFSLEQVRCIGACGLAPAMMVGNVVYGNLDEAGVRALVRRLRRAAGGFAPGGIR